MILICSLPLLEDLRMGCLGVNNSYDSNSVTWPSILPPLTGTLLLSLPGGMEYTIPHVLGLQVFCRFRSLKCTVSYEEDFQCITALIEECSDALKYVFIEDSSAGKLDSLSLCRMILTPNLTEHRAFVGGLGRPF